MTKQDVIELLIELLNSTPTENDDVEAKPKTRVRAYGERGGFRWRESERQAIWDLMDAGWTEEEIADVFQRSAVAIRDQIILMKKDGWQ